MMDGLPRIQAIYRRLDTLLQREIAAAVANGDQAEETKLIDAKDLLEYAFFVLCFGQLEREVNETFAKAYQRRAGNPDWTRRRGWDLDAYRDPSRVPFKDRVALVLDRNGTGYGKIMSDYARRNHVAHGGLTEPLAPIDRFIRELFQLSSELSA